MWKKIALTAAVGLFVIPSVALSNNASDINNLLQNATTDDLYMSSDDDRGVVQGGNVALGGDVKNTEQNITGDDLDMDLEDGKDVVQAANVIGGNNIKNATQNASFDDAGLYSDGNKNSIQAINAATNCVSCD